jgi:hypothetical protein
MITQNFHKNEDLIVLWRKYDIPVIQPIHHHNATLRNNAFSEMRHFCVLAFHLSTPKSTNEIMPVVSKYPMNAACVIVISYIVSKYVASGDATVFFLEILFHRSAILFSVVTSNTALIMLASS